MTQNGIQNEIDFVKSLNGKKLYQLSKNMQDLLKVIFLDINSKSTIACWQSKYYEKADIKIKINNELRGLSIKTGRFCSMHQESTKKFYPFLIKIGVDTKIINLFDNFMHGTINNKKVDASTYIKYHEPEITVIRKTFNEYYTKANLIIRFLFQGTEIQKYDCDAIIYGTPTNFLWATKHEILNFLLNYEIKKYNHINISALNIKNYDRNLKNIKSRKEKENQIQVKWYFLKEDLMYIIKLREAKNIKNNRYTSQ